MCAEAAHVVGAGVGAVTVIDETVRVGGCGVSGRTVDVVASFGDVDAGCGAGAELETVAVAGGVGRSTPARKGLLVIMRA